MISNLLVLVFDVQQNFPLLKANNRLNTFIALLCWTKVIQLDFMQIKVQLCLDLDCLHVFDITTLTNLKGYQQIKSE